jgi:bifunctional non-homologous end joining protein LigD
MPGHDRSAAPARARKAETDGEPVEIRCGRRTVTISRPAKQLFPCGTTKLDLARHYAAVGDAMLPHVADRPLNLERYPDGIERQRIMQQHATDHFPDWIARFEVPKRGGSVAHVVARDVATLVYLANQACITFHAWPSRIDRLDRPDRVIVDVDPDAHDAATVRGAARTCAALLAEVGLVPFAMTSGSRGYHVVAPLLRRQDGGAVRAFAAGLARLAVTREPSLFTTEMRKEKRGGRILIDVMRSRYAHTSVAPYSVRARPGAPVATPLVLEELDADETTATRFTLRDVPARLDELGDPWREIAGSARALAEPQRQLEALLDEVGAG